MISVSIVEGIRVSVLISFKIAQNRDLWNFIISAPILEEIDTVVLIPVL